MNSPSPDKVKQLKEMVESLRSLEGRSFFWRRKKWRVFGARRHQYQWLPTLTEQQLCEFEAKHKITLPADYRLFLKLVGNGLAGPSYGLAPLDKACLVSNLSRPFLLTQPSDSYEEEELPELGIGDQLSGVLQLSHHGCGMYSYLVVNGPTYGKMWYDNGEFCPTEQSFYDWYLEWVEKQLALLEKQQKAP